MWKEQVSAQEASLRFTLPGSGTEGPMKQENFILGSCGPGEGRADAARGCPEPGGREPEDAQEQPAAALRLPGGQAVEAAADPRCQEPCEPSHLPSRQPGRELPVQDRSRGPQAMTSPLPQLMDAVMLQLTRARNRLTTPATLTLPEIAASGLTRMFAPALPSDLLVNFYINLNKLCLTVYQLHALQPNSTKNFRPAGGAVLHSPGAMFEWGAQRLEVSHVHKVECVIPWLNDALVFFTVSLQLCQQLKDKISVFSSYWSYRPF
ncbi:protein rogdi homolog isoform X3 [Phacochoerus africanus]|uniref:protein rogdi homolog isoform X3 n=1 Tax=Phacochoerus africanus TaxID=41426 RepID=UPI001FD905FF|nr:protein rogdi homolog isoform X3 [Phacochoerus africanus]